MILTIGKKMKKIGKLHPNVWNPGRGGEYDGKEKQRTKAEIV
jgi:hypothetical protein